MSPRLAWQSPVFLFYAALAAGLLLVGGLVVALLRWRFGKKLDHAWAAYRGWLVIVPLLLLVYFLGREAVIAFLTTIALFGFREFARATDLERDWLCTGVVYVGIGALGVLCWLVGGDNAAPGTYRLFMSLPVLVIALIMAVPVVRNRAEQQLQRLALAVLGFVYFGCMFAHLALLANSDHAYSYLGYLVLAVELNDVAAYTVGKLFGRHLLRSHISPKKTWEGAAGGLAVSLLLPWCVRFTLPHFDALDCVVVGCIVGIGGQVGDLVVSIIKREVGIKDMGAAIPGHGGILDRIDSLIYVAPLFAHYVGYRNGLQAAPLYSPALARW
jgi:phosphatidate cytidylyltransferase